jgi:pyruvate/2-oxoglutarate dehydrogenase complex dihydrolipoamide acyltransferase (E2) component
MSRTTFPLAVALAALACLQGCVAWEIRDEIRTANKQLTGVQSTLGEVESTLGSVQGTLGQTNERLDRVETSLTKLDQTNSLIDSVQSGMARIDTTNTSLGSLQTRLELLQSINTSLNHLDAHLASLRKTIGKLDGAIPFLDLGGDAPAESPAPEPVAAAAPADAPAPTADPAQPADAASPAATPAGQPRNALAGVWISRNTAPASILYLAADNTYILQSVPDAPAPAPAPAPAAPSSPAAAGKPPAPTPASTGPAPRGTWSRSGDTIELTSPPTETTLPDGTKKNDSTTTRWKILLITQRSLVVESDGKLAAYGKP